MVVRETSIREAKSGLTALVRAAEDGQPVRLTRHGKPVAVLLSVREYLRLSERAGRGDPWEFLQSWHARLPKDFVGIADEEADSWRDRSPEGGRKTTWDE